VTTNHRFGEVDAQAASMNADERADMARTDSAVGRGWA